jgi:hypothetical protein
VRDHAVGHHHHVVGHGQHLRVLERARGPGLAGHRVEHQGAVVEPHPTGQQHDHMVVEHAS